MRLWVYGVGMSMNVRRWASLAGIALACLVAEGATVVAIACGVGAVLPAPSIDPVPAAVPGIDFR